MPDIQHNQEEEGNLNTAAQVLLLGDNNQAETIDGYLQQMFHKTVFTVEICSDADCLFAAVLKKLANIPFWLYYKWSKVATDSLYFSQLPTSL